MANFKQDKMEPSRNIPDKTCHYYPFSGDLNA